jgi:hypothetical protein
MATIGLAIVVDCDTWKRRNQEWQTAVIVRHVTTLVAALGGIAALEHHVYDSISTGILQATMRM